MAEEEKIPTKAKGILRIWKAFLYSLDGLKAALRGEDAFRLEVMCAIVLFPAAYYLPVDMLRKVFLFESMFLVLFAELINIGLEVTVNFISEEYHAKAKIIKDVGSAAVFLTLLNAGAMWIWALMDLGG